MKLIATCLSLFMAVSAFAQTQINSVPYTISVPGVYELKNNFQSTAPVLITITTGNVSLDLAGHTLSGTGPASHVSLK